MGKDKMIGVLYKQVKSQTEKKPPRSSIQLNIGKTKKGLIYEKNRNKIQVPED